MSITPVITPIAKYVDTIRYFLESDLSPLRDYPIVLDNPLAFHRNTHLYPTTKFIFYNSEQCSRRMVAYAVYNIAKNYSDVVELWDYSAKNVEILGRMGISARHVPVQSPPSYTQTLQTYREGQHPIYDVGFCGTLSERRKNILREIQGRGYSVLIDDVSFGEERDRKLAQCRILINIHYDTDYCIFESARCDPWVTIGVPVISEESWDNDPRIINVPYDQLVDRTVELLQQTP